MKIQTTNDGWRTQRGGAPVAVRSSSVTSYLSLQSAFTLLEVIVACAIFFMVAFAILEMVTTSLIAAKKLQVREPDPGIVLHAGSLSNRFEEGSFSGSFEDMAPGMYPGYTFVDDRMEVMSNGLYAINVVVYNERDPKRGPMVISTLRWCPNCPPGSMTKGRP